jgi:peroxiredoxin Q/BCP
MIEEKTNSTQNYHEEIIIKTQNQKTNDLTKNSINQIHSKLTEGALVPNLVIKSLFGSTFLHKYKTHNLIIFFYPKDNTPGCTIECEDFSKLHPDFLKIDTQVIGVSRDNIRSHKKFFNKFNLTVNLIADETEELCLLFDVIKEKNMYGRIVRVIDRSTFFIDSSFLLRKIWRGVKAKGHAEQVLKEVDSYIKN